MPAVEILAERNILEAIRRGEFDNLPGAGKPLRIEILRNRPANLDPFPEYRERILDKIRG